jgi:hypothetical protein
MRRASTIKPRQKRPRINIIPVADAAALTTAIANRAPGDVLLLATGNYGTLKISGSNTNWVTIRSAEPLGAVFSQIDVSWRNYWRFDGLTLRDNDQPTIDRFDTQSCNHIEILNCHIVGQDTEITYDGNGRPSNHGCDGVYANWGSNQTIKRTKIEWCKFGLRIEKITNMSVIQCDISKSTEDNLRMGGMTNHRIEWCAIYSLRFPLADGTELHPDLIQFTGPGTASNGDIVRCNVIMSDANVEQYGEQGIFYRGGNGKVTHNAYFDNNLIFTQCRHGWCFQNEVLSRRIVLKNSTVILNHIKQPGVNIGYTPQTRFAWGINDAYAINNVVNTFNQDGGGNVQYDGNVALGIESSFQKDNDAWKTNSAHYSAVFAAPFLRPDTITSKYDALYFRHKPDTDATLKGAYSLLEALYSEYYQKNGNTAPFASPVSVFADADVDVDIDVLSNCGDFDFDTLTVTDVTQPANGLSSVQPGGVGVTYRADVAYQGEDSFTYTISDGHGGTDTATVTVRVADSVTFVIGDFTDYAGQTPNQSTLELIESDKGLKITGHRAVKYPYPYTVTTNTRFAFNFKSTGSLPQLVSIGLDDDNSDGTNPETNIKLWGESWTGTGYTKSSYDANAEWQYYDLPIGTYFTGSMLYLTFQCRHTSFSIPSRNAWFRNVRLYEAT